jgi:hypothetical protein
MWGNTKAALLPIRLRHASPTPLASGPNNLHGDADGRRRVMARRATRVKVKASELTVS